MTERAGQESIPDEQPAARAGDGSSSMPKGPVALKPPQSLERLRERVRTAARELDRLRKENDRLLEHIKELETRPPVDLEGTVLVLDEDPEALREKVEGFIQAIDRYLAPETD